MKVNSPVAKLIGISFRYQKSLLVNRIFSVLLFATLSALFYYFLGAMAIYIGFSVAVFADFYLTKDRSRLLLTTKSKEFGSILPMSRFEKFQLLLFDNLMDYFVSGSIICFLALYSLFPELTKTELIIFYIFTLIHAFFYGALPLEYQIIDKNLMPRNKSLLSFIIILTNILITTFIGLYVVAGLIILKITSNTLNLSLSEKILIPMAILIVDFFVIKKYFFKKEFHANEHALIKNRQVFKTLPTIRSFIITTISLILFTFGTLLWIRSNIEENYNAFKFITFTKLYESPIYSAFKKDDALEFSRHFNSDHDLKGFEWFNNEFLLKRSLSTQKENILESLLGLDPFLWDTRICELTNRSPCQKGIFVWLAYQAGENPYYLDQFKKLNGEIEEELKIDLMKQSIAKCDAEFLKILKEDSPKLLTSLIQDKRNNIVKHFRKSPNLSECTDTALVLFK